MKSVMLSIKPKYCELIAGGKKTIEVRKTRPKIETPFKSYIYCTKGKLALLRDNEDKSERYKFEHWSCAKFHEKCGKTLLNGKVIGEFVCDDIKPLRYDVLEKCYILRTVLGFDLNEEFMEGTCLSYNEIFDYCKNLTYDNSHTDMFYGWHISDLVIYDEPKELSEFGEECNLDCPSVRCPYWRYQRVNADEWDYDCSVGNFKPLTHPPQSWCYVEDKI